MLSRAVLTLDTASPVVSVAAGLAIHAASEGPERRSDIAVRTAPQRRSSPLLIGLVDEVLVELGIGLPDLDLVVAVRGPGSFTGIRVGLATAMGFHQALGLPTTAVSSLAALAATAALEMTAPSATVLAAVDARRGDWNVERFRVGAGSPPRSLEEPRRVPAEEIGDLDFDLVVGFGTERLATTLGRDARILDLEAAPADRLGPPAVTVARLALTAEIDLDPGLLSEPLYLRPPAVDPPGEPKSVSGEEG